MKDLIIVTGATGGMGYEAVLHFKNDYKILMLDINEDKLKEVKTKMNADIDYLKFDITNEEDMIALSTYLKNAGGFKHLLHFAGVSEVVGNIELIYKINLIGTKNLLDNIYDYILPGGVIVNTSSITAYTTPLVNGLLEVLNKPESNNFLTEALKLTETPNQAYGFSKLGVLNLSKREGMKWGKKQARIVSISPGAIKTPMVEAEMDKNADAIKRVVELTPAGRMGLPIDIINTVDFLISDKASFITGTDILVDGGVTEVFKTSF